MKKLASLILVVILTGVGCLGLSVLSAKPAYAASCEHSILGLRPWYAGLEMDDKCVVKSPEKDKLTLFVWTIVLNVLSDVFIVAGYLAIGFVIYGGMMYIMSSGEPGKIAKGKQILTSAVIGLIITLLATVIVNIIISVLTGAAK